VQVSGLARGNATLSTAAIGQRIEEAVCQVPNVAEVRASVTSKKNGVLVALDLQVDPEANLATVTDEACQVAEDVLENRVHVSLLKPPTARLHYRELRLQGRNGARRVTLPPSVPIAPPPEAAIAAPFAVATSRGGTAVADLPPEPPVPPELPEALAHHNGEPPVEATGDNGAVADNGDEEKTT
jgi:hypothetical protein